MTGYVLAFSYQGKIEDIIVRGYCRKTHRGASGRERMCEGICQTSGTEVVFHCVCLKQACRRVLMQSQWIILCLSSLAYELRNL